MKNIQTQSSFLKLCKKKLSHERKDSSSEIQHKHNNDHHQDKNKKDLEAVFAYMDTNKDGRISPKEIQNSFKTLGEELSDQEAETAIRLSDIDGDGMLDFQEFAYLIKGGNDDDDFTEEDKKIELKEAFRMYIEDGEECITPRSLKIMLKKLGESRTSYDCKVMIQAFDLNHDGVLSFDEFALMMR
ncbi:unnamed protein product [Cochlearia groenlandica]